MDTSTTLLCQTSTGQEDDWKTLYESSFPLDERMAVEDIRQLLTKGQMLLHKTLNKQGELLCFSLVFPVTDFTLLSYIATNPTKRSGGYGSKHLKRLLELFKTEYPKHIGMFLEIESTREKGLDPEVQKLRNRRLDFYQRLGAKRLLKDYFCPNLGQPGGAPRAGELLWVDFGTTTIDEAVLARVIKEIYERAYLLPCDNSLVQQVLSQFKPHLCQPAAAQGSATADGSTGSSAADSSAATTDTAASATTPAPTATPTTEAPAQPAPTAPENPPAAVTPAPAGDTNGGARPTETEAPAQTPSLPTEGDKS